MPELFLGDEVVRSLLSLSSVDLAWCTDALTIVAWSRGWIVALCLSTFATITAHRCAVLLGFCSALASLA